MIGPDRRRLLSALRSAAAARGWRDPGDAIRATADRTHDAWVRGGKSPSAAEIASFVPGAYLARNEIEASAVGKAFATALATVHAEEAEPLIAAGDIESFASIRNVTPASVAKFANPLNLPELAVKLFIASILGEPYVPKDWGGEGNDIYTDHIRYGGREIGGAFLLKGAGTRGRLTVAKLGTNGDQIIRLASSPAELLVVQHVASIDEAVRTSLMHTVVARRHGGTATVGSTWDGTTCARLFVAHGFLDPASGRVTPAGRYVTSTQT